MIFKKCNHENNENSNLCTKYGTALGNKIETAKIMNLNIKQVQKIAIPIFVIVLGFFMSSCNFMGNSYSNVKIGNQVWMTENLDLEYFRNGDKIPEVKSDAEWARAGRNEEPAWCYYENSSANGEKYGKLYNWYAVIDARGRAPKGWHIPTKSEFQKLKAHVNNTAAKLIDESQSMEKDSPTNETGFSALFAGYRDFGIGNFTGEGNFTAFWCSTEYSGEYADYMFLNYHNSVVGLFNIYKNDGFSVRCLKD